VRRTLTTGFLLSLLIPAALAAAPKPARDPVGWPDTPAGAFARDYVTAFNGGDEAMKAFYARAFTPESLVVRPPEKRLTRYHDLREKIGTLAFGGVVKDSVGQLTVRLLDADAVPHEFTFEVGKAKPIRLLRISLKQTISGHGGFGGFHH